MLHKRLVRQIKRYLGGLGAVPDSLQPFIRAVNAAYQHAEAALQQREHSLERAAQKLLLYTQQIQRELAEQRQVTAALHDREIRSSLVTQAAENGLWDWDFRTGQIYFSQRWKRMLGYAEAEIGASLDEWFSRIHPEDLTEFKAALDGYLASNQPAFGYEYRIQHKDGSYRCMICRGSALRDDQNQPVRMAGLQTDITRRRIEQERQRHAALHDPLTDLPNRTLFMDHLGQAIDVARGNPDYLFAVLFLDLDRFKVINDSLGHLMGDKLLIGIAQRLSACVRPQDTIARLGGDEFTILLSNVYDLAVVIEITDRIQRELAVPFMIGGHEVFTSVSIGIALNTRRYDRPENLLRDADIALYRAKTLGKARYEVFHNDMHEHAMTLLRLEAELRRALERQEFVLYYQPIISLSSGTIAGCEILIRWQHPQRGLLYPAEFIHLVEETGMITPIDEWVLLQACTQMKEWQARGLSPIFSAINISVRTFKQPALLGLIRRILIETDLEARYLELELNESAMIGHANDIVGTMLALKSLGVRLSIDDFGTGYSSLSYLKRLPLDTLKIDHSFVVDITTNPADAAIATTIIRLARSLNLDVIAEGIETVEQMAYLEQQQCDLFQGYLFSPPLPAAEFAQLLETGWNVRTHTGSGEQLAQVKDQMI